MNKPILAIAYLAGARIPSYRVVKFGDEPGSILVAAAGTDLIIGCSTAVNANEGTHVSVNRIGFAPIEYGETITRGQRVTSDADGRLAVAVAGDYILGVAELDGDEGEIGSVFICLGTQA